MKQIAVALLVATMLCHSTLAMAGEPVPFRALMRNGGAQPGVTPISAFDDQSAAASNSAHKTHMTAAGKVMTGVGIVFVGFGGLVMGLTPNAFATQTDKNELYAASGATMGVGVVLIVLGVHRRSAK